MVRHVVMFTWAEGLDPGHAVAVGAALDELRAIIPGIAGYHHGSDAGINAGNFDFAITAEFASVADYLVYRDHPAHQAFIATHIAGKVAARAAVQFEA